ncbi:hypothetical protein AB0L82_29305 [Nocardia sp. NPDC052001]|uniref:hypothetical protein n=1 Tax=Nocardia sp. NPDC052001 TaxID=3154853 RepID=UPI003433598B
MAPQPNSPDPSGTDGKVPPAASHSGFGGQIGSGQSQSTHGLGSAVSPVQNSTTPEKPATTAQDPAILNLLYPGINLPKPKDEQPQRPSEKDIPAYNPNTVGLVPPAAQPAHTLHSYDPSTGAQADVTIPAQKPAAASDPYAASKVRLADVNGQPRYAVLNAAGEYLFTIDANGNRVTPANQPNSADSTKGLGVGAGAALATGATQLGTAEAAGLTGAELGAMVLEGAELGGAIGAVGGEGVGAAPGAVIGAAASLVVGLGLMAGYWYENHNRTKPTPTPDERVDPNSLPDTTYPTPNGGLQPQQNVAPPVDPSVRPTPSDDPDTVQTRILFPSAVPGQPGVPVEGMAWQGNQLVWPKGNPAGMRPGFAADPNRPNKISLSADLFLLKTWSGKLEDVDEKYRPKLAALIASIAAAQGVRDALLAGIVTLAGTPGVDADINELTNGTARLNAELKRLRDRGQGAAADLLNKAVGAWWKAVAPVDDAKELLGHAGAIAVLETDGWEVNTRTKGGNKHDLVAFKNGQLMIVETKGGIPGKPRVGNASIPDGAGGNYLGEQMTDPYLWYKLKQDAANDPEFKQWLIDRGMLEAVEAEDASKIGYRLIKTDTNGKIQIYGSTQEKAADSTVSDSDINKTTGTPPGTPEGEGNGGPTLHGVALPMPVAFDAPAVGTVGPWITDVSRTLSATLKSLSALIPPISPIPAPQVRASGAEPAPAANLALHISYPAQSYADRAETGKVLGYGARILK